MSSVDRRRLTAYEVREPGWGSCSAWEVVAWIAAFAAILAGVAYLGLRPDAWDSYQKDFGCAALSNTDSSHPRPRCKAADTAGRDRVSANGSSVQPARHGEPPGLAQ